MALIEIHEEHIGRLAERLYETWKEVMVMSAKVEALTAAVGQLQGTTDAVLKAIAELKANQADPADGPAVEAATAAVSDAVGRLSVAIEP